MKELSFATYSSEQNCVQPWSVLPRVRDSSGASAGGDACDESAALLLGLYSAWYPSPFDAQEHEPMSHNIVKDSSL